MEKRVLKPDEILEASIDLAESKSKGGFARLAVLGFLAGAFIALAASGSNMAAFNLLSQAGSYGIGRVVAGSVFAVGLIMVVLCGGELFTGNVLMVGGVIRKRVRLRSMAFNWCVVYAANFAGAVAIAWAISRTGLLHSGADMLGGITIKIAAGKTGLGFEAAFIMGIFCNWLVCLAVWLSLGADSMAGKIMGIFFPIWLFVVSGFEHSVANMYFIPAGLFAKGDSSLAAAALSAGATPAGLEGLTWGNFFVANLLPVTLGNIVGGGVFVSMAYLLAYRKKGGSGRIPGDGGARNA